MSSIRIAVLSALLTIGATLGAAAQTSSAPQSITESAKTAANDVSQWSQKHWNHVKAMQLIRNFTVTRVGRSFTIAWQADMARVAQAAQPNGSRQLGDVHPSPASFRQSGRCRSS
jgi:hypothetical protein